MTALCDINGLKYRLESDAVINGGEACIHRVRGDNSVLAKVYHKPQEERAMKLASMLANPPKNPTAKQRHHAYAWPRTLLRQPGTDAVVGFLMPRLQGMREVADFYNPGMRRRTCVHFNYKYLMQTARNIAGVMSETSTPAPCISAACEPGDSSLPRCTPRACTTSSARSTRIGSVSPS
jgi:DNA-binding helix-hairpin-helix protein with protein kinase domain